MYRASIIKSIQTGSVDLNNVTSNTVTLSTTVDANNAYLIWTGDDHATASNDWNKKHSYIRLANNTSVIATREVADASTYRMGYTVIEYTPGIIKTVQSANVQMQNVSSNTFTLVTTVNAAKSMVLLLGSMADSVVANTGGQGPEWFEHRVALTNNTTVTCTRGTAIASVGTYGWKIFFSVVEFK